MLSGELFVTYFNSPRSKIAVPLTLDIVLRRFISGEYAENISYVRGVLASKGHEEYSIAKKTLPVIAFCGVFSNGHAKNNIIDYNNLLVFDIDHLSGEEMREVKRKLESDEFVMAFWISPSNNGYKGLIRLDFQANCQLTELDTYYKRAFSIIAKYFQERHNIQLDKACSDYSRLCYVCWDEDLYYHAHSTPFVIDCANILIKQNKYLKSRVQTSKYIDNCGSRKPANVKGKNKSRSRIIISSITKYLKKRSLSITSSYEEWLRVAFAIASTFNYDLGKKYYLNLCRLDRDRYDEAQCIKKLEECYRTGLGEITLGTIIEMAKEKGYHLIGSSEGL